jgi:spore coat protein U-like protein
MRRLILIVIAAALVSPAARAGNCSWVTNPTNVTFGNYSVFGSTSVVSTSSYIFRCTPNTSATLTFTTGGAGTYFPRRFGGASGLTYNIYDDAATTVVIGDGSGGTTSRVIFNSTPKDKDYDDVVYGKVLEGADIPAGTYTDSITATLSWGNGTITSTFTVTLVVLPECTIAASSLGFGTYDPIVANKSTPLDSTSSVDVYCTRNTSATISLGNGLWFSGGRRLRNPRPDFLPYALYRDSGRTAPWGPTAPNVVSRTSTSKLTPMSMIVYGRIAANEDPSVGAYSDTVQATVNY